MKKHDQVALCKPDGEVALWAYVTAIRHRRDFDFFVLNGGWPGTFKDNVITVHETGSALPGRLKWVGKAPFTRENYNDAILWLNRPRWVIALDQLKAVVNYLRTHRIDIRISMKAKSDDGRRRPTR